MKRITALFIALIMLAALIPAAHSEDVKPDGWWPALEAYTAAVESGDVDRILAAGDEYIRICSTVPLNEFTANQFYNVYLKRMQLSIFENRANYAAATENTRKLLEVSTYLTSIGVDRRDMILTCRTHLNALAPSYGVYALSANATQPATAGIPEKGTLYGAISGSETLNHKGITSFYVELELNSARDFAYMIEPFADGTRAILINYNFQGEGDTARAIPGGKYDAKIDDSLAYISTLTVPVLLRIGGEMNVWTKTVSAADFIAAYEYIAAKAREICPNAALVWSPNCVSAWDLYMADYFPADKYVDWVGVSLYYKYSTPETITAWVEWAHQGRFSDPVIHAEETVAVARAHKKPVIVTEGGTVHNTGDAAQEKWAKEKVAKELSTLNMVFPEVKAILFFDKVQEGRDYTISGGVKTAADAAIGANPALADSLDGAAGTWTGLGALNEGRSGSVLLGAAGHTYLSAEMGAVWRLDGEVVCTTDKAPNHYELDLTKLAKGSHKLEVTLSDGAGYSVTLKYRLKFDGYTVKAFAPGDVNGDGKVNAKDVTAIMKALTGVKQKSYDSFVADFNADGKVNAKDVTALMKFLVGAH